jgi:hypothetical protein
MAAVKTNILNIVNMTDIEFGNWKQTVGLDTMTDVLESHDENVARLPPLPAEDNGGNDTENDRFGDTYSETSSPPIRNSYLEMRAKKIGRNWERLASLSLIGDNEASKEINHAWNWSAEAVYDSDINENDWCHVDTLLGIGRELDDVDVLQQKPSAKSITKKDDNTIVRKNITQRVIDKAGCKKSSKGKYCSLMRILCQ